MCVRECGVQLLTVFSHAQHDLLRLRVTELHPIGVPLSEIEYVRGLGRATSISDSAKRPVVLMQSTPMDASHCRELWLLRPSGESIQFQAVAHSICSVLAAKLSSWSVLQVGTPQCPPVERMHSFSQSDSMTVLVGQRHSGRTTDGIASTKR